MFVGNVIYVDTLYPQIIKLLFSNKPCMSEFNMIVSNVSPVVFNKCGNTTFLSSNNPMTRETAKMIVAVTNQDQAELNTKELWQ